MKIPLAKPWITSEDIVRVTEILQSGQLALGSSTTGFEEALAHYVGTRHAVAVNGGTSALHLIIRVLELGPGDEVITAPFSFISSTGCIFMEGATPVFADIDPQTLCIDPDPVEAAITPHTKAILAVDVFGHPADWSQLETIADKYSLALIEDSAESLGSSIDGKLCGSFGSAAIFGFYPNKQITTGEGGMMVTDDEQLAERCRSMANQGLSGDRWLSHERLGYNYRMDEMSAALGLSQLGRIDQLISARAQVADWYLNALQDIDGIILPTVVDNVHMSWFVFVIRLAESFTREDRDRTLDALRALGIGCRDYFQPIHLQPFIQERMGTKRGDFPIAEATGDRTIALPFFPQMTREQVLRVAEALSAAIER